MQNLTVQERSNQPPSKSYNRQDWQRGYESQPREQAYWVEEIEGEIPPQLEGTLFRNGPGLLDINGMRIHHPFDGDGMVCAIAFRNGRAFFQNRFVRTEGFLKEQAAGKILYRGVFGTQKPGGWLNNAFDLQVKTIANTNVIYWGKKLLALWEASKPYSLDPYTLETLGLDDLEGALAPDESFSAHPRIDPACQLDGGAPCLVNFCLKPGLSTKITIYEFNPSGKLLRKHAHSLPGFAFIHDFAITPNYCLFFQNPVRFNPLPFILGLRSPGQCIKFQPQQPTRIVVIPRDPNSRKSMQILEAKTGFVFHHANAFEYSNDELCIDSICYEDFPDIEPESDFRQVDFDALKPGQLWRFRLNLKAGTIQRQLLLSRCCEFPSTHPQTVGRSYRYLFLAAADQPQGNAPQQAIVKFDWETGEQQIWSAAPRGFVGEPVFVPQPGATGEDEGWVLTMVYDAACHRSDLVILDGRDLNREPVAKLHLKYHIPYGLHGSWSQTCWLRE